MTRKLRIWQKTVSRMQPSSANILHTQVLLVVERVVEMNDERMAEIARHALENSLLCEGVLELLMSENVALDDRFLEEGQGDRVSCLPTVTNERQRPQRTIASSPRFSPFFCLTSSTFPAQPLPSTRMSSKSSIVTLGFRLVAATASFRFAPSSAHWATLDELLSGSAEAGRGGGRV
jgi:hypothetical protein